MGLSLDDANLFYISEENALANLELEDDGQEQGQRNRFFLALTLAAWNLCTVWQKGICKLLSPAKFVPIHTCVHSASELLWAF